MRKWTGILSGLLAVYLLAMGAVFLTRALPIRAPKEESRESTEAGQTAGETEGTKQLEGPESPEPSAGRTEEPGETGEPAAQTQPEAQTQPSTEAGSGESLSEQELLERGKVIYLTFDDGPSVYTDDLLDILAKYYVKATFFVTGQFRDYSDRIAREREEGHTVGIHTLTHVYNKIYASEEAYLADFEAMDEIIYEQTGERAQLVRFPGGSSNRISEFNPGIMTRLVKILTERGYHYYDWNVVSGDAGETEDTDQIVQNVIDGVSKKGIAVVLQHDIYDYSIAAVERIILWGRENGYAFLPLTMDSPIVHHTVVN